MSLLTPAIALALLLWGTWGCQPANRPSVLSLNNEDFTAYLEAVVNDQKPTLSGFNPHAPLSSDHCLADLEILKRCLEEAQTPLYRYASKAEIDHAFTLAFKRCQPSPTYLDMVRTIARLQKLIAC